MCNGSTVSEKQESPDFQRANGRGSSVKWPREHETRHTALAAKAMHLCFCDRQRNNTLLKIKIENKNYLLVQNF